MNRQTFIDKSLDNMINEDPDIKKYFDNAKTEEERRLLESGLKQSLNASYDKYADGYFSNKGIGSYVSKFFRVGGAVADTIGTYAFWALSPGWGLEFKFAGFVTKTVSDIIDHYHYQKYREKEGIVDKYVNKDGLAILGETAVERIAAYLPIGIGELADLVRGFKKYDAKIIGSAMYHAKNEFIKQFGDYKPVEKPNVIPLSYFENPDYRSIDDAVLQPAA